MGAGDPTMLQNRIAKEIQTGGIKWIAGVDLMESKAEMPCITEACKTWVELKWLAQVRSE